MNKTTLFTLLGAGAIGAGALAAAIVFGQPESAQAARAQPPLAIAAPAAPAVIDTISAVEADAWAQARAADSADAYKVYIAAYPTGAFHDDAVERLAKAKPIAKSAAKPVRTVRAVAPAPLPAEPQVFPAVNQYPQPQPAPVRDVAALCRAQVDQMLSKPSRTYRVVGGAAAGCGAGTLAGGDDGRNCAVGAIVGGAIGAVTAENRERRREREIAACVANGGPG
jgi:hypothetical protein